MTATDGMASGRGESVLILGATSAVAERFARLHAARGASLMLVGRNGSRLAALAADLVARGAARAEPVELDLVAPATGFAGAWSELAARFGGRIDTLLLAYGILGDQTVAETDPDEALRVIDTDMRSACAWLTVAAGHFERQGFGILIAIASVAGDRGRRTNYVYGAAKAGLAVFMEGLAHRFAATPIKILTVKPGFIDTPMTAALPKGGPLWATADRVAADIDRAARRGRTVVYTPWFWWAIMLVIRNLPRALFNRLKI
jgi:short-subunit dehydrogenase